MTRAVFLVLLALVTGCGQRSIKLDPRWLPLERIVEASWVADGMVTTIAPIVYTRHLDDLPEGEWLNGLLTHEQVHARHELDQGISFYRDYAAFPTVRWEEEKSAWRAEITYMKSVGQPWDDARCLYMAKMASENYYGMITDQVALAFFRAQAGAP